MGKGQRHEAKVSLGLGAVYLGRGRQNADHPELWNQIFTVRKNGFEYLGQLTVRSVSPAIDVEVFNSNYFADFCLPKKQIVDSLQTKILGLIARNGDSQATFKTAVRALLKKNIPRAEPAFSSYGEMSNGLIDLDEIYRRLNDQYFGGGVQARVMWGRDSRTRNRSGFRFGSYEDGRAWRHSRNWVPQYWRDQRFAHRKQTFGTGNIIIGQRQRRNRSLLRLHLWPGHRCFGRWWRPRRSLFSDLVEI